MHPSRQAYVEEAVPEVSRAVKPIDSEKQPANQHL